MKDPSVSVVICAYTEARWLRLVDAVASVASQLRPTDEVVVCVDHNPALLERAHGLPGVRVVANAGPRGLSGARNTALSAVGGDVVAFLDDDAEAGPNWLTRLVEGYTDEHVIGVGGSVLPAWPGEPPVWFPPEFSWVVGCTHSGMPSTDAPVRNFVGANMSFRRSVFDRVGGFRTELGRVGGRPVGCEETELCIRAAQALPGSVLLYRPSASVRHHVEAPRTEWRYFSSRCWHEGVSKAMVARLAGPDRALAEERAYVRSVLPRAVGTAVADAARRRRPGGLRRASAIVAGLGLTAAGYARGAGLPPIALSNGGAG